MTTPAHRPPHRLAAKPLTRDAFAPFGEVIEISDDAQRFTINGGNTERYHDLARIEPGPDGRVIVSIFRAQPRSLPLIVEIMERHPLGSQTFVPLSHSPYLVVVAPAGDAPGVEDLRVFVARGDQGVNFAPGTWHHPLLAIDAVSDFLVIDREGDGANCDEVRLADTGVVERTF